MMPLQKVHFHSCYLEERRFSHHIVCSRPSHTMETEILSLRIWDPLILLCLYRGLKLEGQYSEEEEDETDVPRDD